ncbi:Glycine betaine/carnitine transport binding protein GbuC precursor [Oceanobacillus picturae]|uniref:Glycine betaine/carnitine transport binding protein GbuC n=1 Tax=Oceanobacillus picturae TaxID=171693 RepID=W9AHA1_9BACI|nr:glycine betaine ABC transporter substrate-binding protein [Oceanobacillus picturae]CDO04868.1 Glycine betaine/carnitine transport binding protein GbuC precursor [Oceanobacillus picturae]
MMNFKRKILGIFIVLILSLMIAGCGSSNEDAQAEGSVSEELDYTITGTEPGAGQTKKNEEVLESYDNLAGWEQELSSAGAMLSQLSKAIDNKEPIIFSAWSPHYKFAKWDLKYLKDPKGIHGDEEKITTIARKGLKDEMPEAYTIIDRIQLELPDVEEALLEAQEKEYAEVVKDWAKENQETVAEWTEGVDSVDGTSIEIALLPWDDAIFTANVAKFALEQKGYDVTLTQVDPAIMFEAIATGSADASLAVWMPVTHAELYKQYEDDFDDLGPNLEGAKTGLAVPAYMDIDSLEDLEPKE